MEAIIIINIIITIIIIVLYYEIVPTKQKKKERDCTIYDVEIVCLTMEIQVYLIEPKY